MSDQGCGGCRFRHDRVAGNQRCRDLPRKNGERKVPRTDADNHAASVQGQHVPLARRPLQDLSVAELLSGSCRVVSAEVHGFPHFGDAIRQCPPGFAYEQIDEIDTTRFQQVRGALQARGSLIDGGRLPCRVRAARSVHGAVDFRFRRIPRIPDDIARITGRNDRDASVGYRAAA